MENKLKQLIETSERILITSHISPDPDAISSTLLLGQTLKENFADKRIDVVLEEEPLGLDSVPGYDIISFGDLVDKVKRLNPDLVFIVDANNYGRVSRSAGDEIRAYLRETGAKTVIIDHHEPAGREDSDIYINQGSPAAAQDVYEVCFDKLKLRKPADFAQLAMLGLYSDSGGFAYRNQRHSDTLKLADELISSGADIEKIINLTNQYTEDDMRVFAELARNISHQDDYSYSYIGDEFVDEWIAGGKSGAQLHKGTEGFVNNFIRNIDGRLWGFIVYRNVLQGDNVYSASFRSTADAKDVSLLAAALGGGGHKPAAGAKFEAKSVEQAVEKIKHIISTTP
jgi:phosphoesterase RecJ-like protein